MSGANSAALSQVIFVSGVGQLLQPGVVGEAAVVDLRVAPRRPARGARRPPRGRRPLGRRGASVGQAGEVDLGRPWPAGPDRQPSWSAVRQPASSTSRNAATSARTSSWPRRPAPSSSTGQQLDRRCGRRRGARSAAGHVYGAVPRAHVAPGLELVRPRQVPRAAPRRSRRGAAEVDRGADCAARAEGRGRRARRRTGLPPSTTSVLDLPRAHRARQLGEVAPRGRSRGSGVSRVASGCAPCSQRPFKARASAWTSAGWRGPTTTSDSPRCSAAGRRPARPSSESSNGRNRRPAGDLRRSRGGFAPSLQSARQRHDAAAGSPDVGAARAGGRPPRR